METRVDESLRGSGEASFGVDEGFGICNRVERLIHQHSTQRISGTSTSRVYVRSARTKICIVQSEVMLISTGDGRQESQKAVTHGSGLGFGGPKTEDSTFPASRWLSLAS